MIGCVNGFILMDIIDIFVFFFIISVGKSFKISYNFQLISLLGLENIIIVGEFLFVIGCSELEDFFGLGGIDFIVKNFIIGLNDKLKDIFVMDGINFFNVFIVDNNFELENFFGLEGLIIVCFNLII